MRVNNPRQLAASLYQHIYPRSNFYNRETSAQREWIDGVGALVEAIKNDINRSTGASLLR
jgi:hypothetical protein